MNILTQIEETRKFLVPIIRDLNEIKINTEFIKKEIEYTDFYSLTELTKQSFKDPFSAYYGEEFCSLKESISEKIVEIKQSDSKAALQDSLNELESIIGKYSDFLTTTLTGLLELSCKIGDGAEKLGILNN